jgi:hypothetical protein
LAIKFLAKSKLPGGRRYVQQGTEDALQELRILSYIHQLRLQEAVILNAACCDGAVIDDYFMSDAGITPSPLQSPSPEHQQRSNPNLLTRGGAGCPHISPYVIDTMALVETDYAYFIVMPYYQCELLACRMDSSYGIWDENR